MGTEVVEASAPNLSPAVNFAVGAFLNNWLILIISTAVMYAAQFFTVDLDRHWQALIAVVYSPLFTGGVLAMVLNICDDKPVTIGLLINRMHQFWRFAVGNFLVGIAFTVGCVLFVVPGIILMVRLVFFPLIIADRDVGPIEALRLSWHLTRGKAMRIFGFGLLGGLLVCVPAVVLAVVVGISGFVLGLIFGMPKVVLHVLTTIAMLPVGIFFQLMVAHAYRQLSPPAYLGTGSGKLIQEG